MLALPAQKKVCSSALAVTYFLVRAAGWILCLVGPMVRSLLLLITVIPNGLCFLPSLRIPRIVIHQGNTQTFVLLKNGPHNDVDDDEEAAVRNGDCSNSEESSLVAACEFSDKFGPNNEIRTVDGDRIMYRNGCFSDKKWIPHYGRPIPHWYETKVPLANYTADDLVIDSKGFAWRAQHALTSQGMRRYNMIPSQNLLQWEQNVTMPKPWQGPMDITPEARGLGTTMLREEEKFSGWLLDDERWMVYYTKLVDFCNRFGHADVPLDWNADPPLYRWSVQQRTNYRKYARNNYYQYEMDDNGELGDKITELSPWRIQMLYDLGFSFKILLSWDDRFKQLQKFHDRYGHVEVPSDTMNDDDDEEEFPGLHYWVRTQRTEYRCYQQGMQSTMTNERVKLLNSLAFNWSPNEKAWESRIKELKAYREKNGHLRVTLAENYELTVWLKHVRQQYKIFQMERWESRLTPDRIEQLDDLGIDWDPLESKWQWNFHALAMFSARFGHCQVPVEYEDDHQLAVWVRKQKDAKKRGVMKPNREAQLRSLGFVFQTYDEMFERGFEKLKSYQEAHGNCDVPLLHHDRELVGFVVNQRTQYRDKQTGKVSSLTEERQERLEGVGFVWKVDVNRGAWESGFAKLKAFSEKIGHANVPSNYTDEALYRFVNTQRNEYKKLKDGKFRSSLTSKRVARLEEIGLTWNINEARWVERFNELSEFKRIHGNCNVPDKYQFNQLLATWVRNQRIQYKKLQRGEVSTMTNDRAESLENLGFEWSIRNRQKAKI